MNEVTNETENSPAKEAGQGGKSSSGKGSVKLNGLIAFKVGMTSVFAENGEQIPVTVLRYEPWVVTQVKSKDKDGYEAVQLGTGIVKAKNSSKALSKHAKAAGFENGTKMSAEIRQDLPSGVEVGMQVAIDSLVAGDFVKLTGRSKGRGFAGSVKRWNFAGGPAAHGSKFHRRPGSSGNRTWPGRVMPGKKFPGHFGDEVVSKKNVQVVQVLADENVILVKGGVPGGRNSLVKLMKV